MSVNPLCVITGASQGIGAATALLAAHRGYDLILHYHSKENETQLLQEEITSYGGSCEIIQAEFLDENSLADFGKYLRRLDRSVQAFVANAAYVPPRVPFKSDLNFQQTFRTNIEGTFSCIQQVIPVLDKNSAIVCVGSHSAFSGGTNHCAYAMSKAAIHRMVESLSFELGPDTRVNGVSPGVIDSGKHDMEWMEDVIRNIPLNRVGQPEEVAQAIMWLLSYDASYVNGAIIPVTGGKA